MSHDYVSTACLHEGDDPALHFSCRKTCKFCDAPCQCPSHAAGEDPAPVVAWVDQARSIARELMGMLHESDNYPADLDQRIRADPALFWLRGEERPPGEWRQP